MASSVWYDTGFHCLMVYQLKIGVASGTRMGGFWMEWMTRCEWFSQLALFFP